MDKTAGSHSTGRPQHAEPGVGESPPTNELQSITEPSSRPILDATRDQIERLIESIEPPAASVTEEVDAVQKLHEEIRAEVTSSRQGPLICQYLFGLWHRLVMIFRGWPRYDDYLRNIYVESLASNNGKPELAVGLIDTGSVDDFMSLKLAESLGYKVKPGKQRCHHRCLKGGDIVVVDEIELKWRVTNHRTSNSAWRSDDKYYTGTFFVTDFESDFDILIGIKTINRLKMVWAARNFLAPVRLVHSPRPAVDASSAEQKKKEAAEKRKRVLEEMKRHDAQKDAAEVRIKP